jgi:hypothetical protein
MTRFPANIQMNHKFSAPLFHNYEKNSQTWNASKRSKLIRGSFRLCISNGIQKRGLSDGREANQSNATIAALWHSETLTAGITAS